MSRRSTIKRDDLRGDDLLRLADACDLIFHGALTPASLRLEARRGNLTIERIAGKDFVTPAALKEMRNLCRIPSKADVPAVKSKSAYRMSETERGVVAQAAAIASARALRRQD